MCDTRACATSVGVAAADRARASSWRSFAAADASSARVARAASLWRSRWRLHAIQTSTSATMRLTAQRLATVPSSIASSHARVFVEKQAYPGGCDGDVSRADAEEDGDEHDGAHERRHEHLARKQLRSQHTEAGQGKSEQVFTPAREPRVAHGHRDGRLAAGRTRRDIGLRTTAPGNADFSDHAEVALRSRDEGRARSFHGRTLGGGRDGGGSRRRRRGARPLRGRLRRQRRCSKPLPARARRRKPRHAPAHRRSAQRRRSGGYSTFSLSSSMTPVCESRAEALRLPYRLRPRRTKRAGKAPALAAISESVL